MVESSRSFEQQIREDVAHIEEYYKDSGICPDLDETVEIEDGDIKRTYVYTKKNEIKNSIAKWYYIMDKEDPNIKPVDETSFKNSGESITENNNLILRVNDIEKIVECLDLLKEVKNNGKLGNKSSHQSISKALDILAELANLKSEVQEHSISSKKEVSSKGKEKSQKSRSPNIYNKFISEVLLRLKQTHSHLSPPQRMSIAVKEWHNRSKSID